MQSFGLRVLTALALQVLAIQRQYEGDITGTQLLWARAETAEELLLIL